MKERKATWIELFFDLAFVVAVASIAHEFASHINFNGLITFILLFVPLWWAWVGHTLFNDRFDEDNVLSRILSFLQMIGVAGIAVFAHDAFEDNFAGFAASYIFTRLTLIFSYLLVARRKDEARQLSLNYALGFSLALVPWILGIFMESGIRMYLVVFALIIDIGTPFTQIQNQRKLPLSTSHLPERFGLFTILVLGEIILSSVNALKSSHFTIQGAVVTFTGIFLAFTLWWIYFSNITGSIIKKIKLASQIWVYIHLPLMMGIATLAVALENLIHSISEEALNARDLNFIFLSFAITIFCLTVIDFVRSYKKENKRSESIKIFNKLIIATGSLALGLFLSSDDFSIALTFILFFGIELLVIETLMRPITQLINKSED